MTDVLTSIHFEHQNPFKAHHGATATVAINLHTSSATVRQQFVTTNVKRCMSCSKSMVVDRFWAPYESFYQLSVGVCESGLWWNCCNEISAEGEFLEELDMSKLKNYTEKMKRYFTCGRSSNYDRGFYYQQMLVIYSKSEFRIQGNT